MGVERIRDEGQIIQTPRGKLLGVVDSQTEFDRLVQALTGAGFKARTLCGEEGLQLLERLDQFFFSDMEERVLRRHIEELKAGHVVVAIETASNRLDDAVRIATENGARGLVHFGHVAVTLLTKS